MKTYEWKLVDFYNEVHKSNTFEAKSLFAAKVRATKESGITVRIWSCWYKTRRNWCRDNDVFGRMTAQGLRMLVLQEVEDVNRSSEN